MRRLALLAFLILPAALFAGETVPSPDEAPFEISNWEVVRLRKGASGASNVVTISFNLKNLTSHSFDRIAPLIELRETMGAKAGEMKPASIRYLKPGDETRVSVTAEFVPVFSTYFLYFNYKVEKTEITASYLGVSPFDPPIFVPAKPQSRTIRLLVMGYDLLTDPKTRLGRLDLKLKNFGGLPARRPLVRLRFYSSDRKLLGNPIQTALRSPKTPKDAIEEIPGGEERIYSVMMMNVPTYDAYDVWVDHDPPRPEESLPGGKFSGGAEVEVIVTAAKVERGTLVLDCRARNGLDKPLENLSLDFTLILHRTRVDKEGRETTEKVVLQVAAAKVTPGITLAPGEEKDFSFTMPMPAQRFDDYTFQVSYEERGAEVGAQTPAQEQKTGEISFEVTGGERLVKTGGVRLEGFVLQKGGAGDLDVPVWVIFTDEAGSEIDRRKILVTVPANSRRFFNAKFENLPDFKSYRLEMPDLNPKQDGK